jgi:glycine oxidase
MLAAGIEAEPTEEKLFDLGRYSQSLWPDFAHELESCSGLSIGYDPTGTLMCAFNRDQTLQLRRGVEFQSRLGGRFEWLPGAAARDLEPALAPTLVAAVFSPGDHQVDNRLLGTALIEAFQRAGGCLRTGVPVSVQRSNGRTAVHDGSELQEFDRVIVAAGAWSGEIDGLAGTERPPVRPIKGQMLSLQMELAHPLVRHVIWGGTSYLVPRADGRLIVGATTEERGFDHSITAGGVLALLDDAWRTLPAIEELPIGEIWAGTRPGSPDDMPILGPGATGELLFATGHHRNGILLTPATAELMAELVLCDHIPERMLPFMMERFSRKLA